jgi:hypothetical protein
MTAEDVYTLMALVCSYYPTFSSPSRMQRALWAADLADCRAATAQEALRRWVRWHSAMPPQLGDMLPLVKEVEREAMGRRSTAEAAPGERTPDQVTLLQHMARLTQCMLAPWEDAAGAIHGRLTLRQAAALCRRWSAQYGQRPALAEDFEAIAGQYETMAAEAAVPTA